MKPMTSFCAVFAAAVVFTLAPSSASAALPAPTGFSFAKGVPFTVTGSTGNETLSGFPVLVRFAENSPAGFYYNDVTNRAAADKNDIDLAFVDMSGNGLPFEIDTWDPQGTSLVWVTLPTMASGTQFVMCWGSTSSGKAVCNDNPWSDYVGVWHLNDPGDGVTNVCDSTVNHLDGRTVATSASKTDGKIGKARFITANKSNAGGSPYDSGITVDLASDAAKKAVVDDLVPEFTVSMWIRPQNGSEHSNYNFLVARRGSDKGSGWGAQFDQKNNSYSPIRVYSAAETDDNNDKRGDPANKKVVTAAVSGIVYQEWHKVDIVWTAAAKYVIYVDGVQKASGSLTRDAAANGDVVNLSLGGSLAPVNASDKTGRGFYGDMDEFRIRPGTNSLAWIAADYAQQSGTSLLTAGTVEPYVETSAPAARVTVSAVAYTNATIGVSVGSLGSGATSANVLVQLAATSDFAAPLWATNYSVTATGLRTFPVAGLATNAAYFARALVTNNLDEAVAAGPVSFTTLTPGAPMASASIGGRTSSSIDATVSVTSFGAGSDACTARLEASTNGFATVASFAETALATPGSAAVEVTGLSPFTVYALRIRVINPWGLETLVDLGSAATLPASGAAEIYVDSLGTGNGSSPESALPTIREALDVAASGYTIWVRGGEGRAYGVTNETDTLPIPASLEGLSIRGYADLPGDGGRALVAISDDYIVDGNRAHIISNYAANVTVSGLDFTFGPTAIGKQSVGSSCSILWTAAPFTTLENCLLRMPEPTIYAGSGAASPLVICASREATNLVVRGCEFHNTRCWSANHGYAPIKCKSNALIAGNVFSNVNATATGQQADLVYGKDNTCLDFAFISNVVYGANDGGNLSSGLLFGLYPGPKSAEIAFNRFVADPNARTQQGGVVPHRANLVFGSQFADAFSGKEATIVHHNTIIGGRSAFLFADADNVKRKTQFFSNLILLAPDGTNLVDSSGVAAFTEGRTTSFVSPSCLRNNAYTGVLTGGKATQIEGYDLAGGLDIADNIELVAPPDFVCTNDIYSADFYRYRAWRGAGDLGLAGWAVSPRDYPLYIGALPPLYPAGTLLILR